MCYSVPNLIDLYQELKNLFLLYSERAVREYFL